MEYLDVKVGQIIGFCVIAIVLLIAYFVEKIINENKF